MFDIHLRAVCATCAVLVSVVFIPPPAHGFAPRFVSDCELAKSPVLVVAKWNGAPWKNNSLVIDNRMTDYEVATEIEVSRVIKGDLEPGKHTILVAYPIGWSVEQPTVMGYSSTQVMGDAEATKENLWFLNARRSRLDSEDHWCLETYRGVQPLALEPFFNALRAGDIAGRIPELFGTRDEIVQLRTLEIIAGGNPPWPYEPWSVIRPAQKEPPMKDQADQLQRLVEESKNLKVRRHAIAVYGYLKGEPSAPFMSAKLEDEDPVVRCIALGVIAKCDASITADRAAKAVRGLKNEPKVVCELIKRLEAWDNPVAVSTLIEFLQDDGFAGFLGNDWDVPALKSRAALHKITNHWFPFDVALSREAWAVASKIENSNERTAYLAHAVPDDPKPWQASLVLENSQGFIDVTNVSPKTMTLAKQPTDVFFTCRQGSYGISFKNNVKADASDFVQLDPGKSIRFELPQKHLKPLRDYFTSSSSLDLAYMSNGNKVGVNAWLGVISAGKSDP